MGLFKIFSMDKKSSSGNDLHFMTFFGVSENVQFNGYFLTSHEITLDHGLS